MYYLAYGVDYETPSKVAIDPEEPSLGRIRADFIAPPHTPTSIKRCISRVEGNPALADAEFFEETSCDNPLKEGHLSILRIDGPGLTPNETNYSKRSSCSPPIFICVRFVASLLSDLQ